MALKFREKLISKCKMDTDLCTWYTKTLCLALIILTKIAQVTKIATKYVYFDALLSDIK